MEDLRSPRVDLQSVTRRGFLGAGIGVAASTALPLRSAGAVELLQRALAVQPRGSDLEAAEHVVICMQENRSFDHYFGSYPAVRGFDDRSGGRAVFEQPWPDAAQNPSGRPLLPYHLDGASATPQCAGNADTPIHNWAPQHQSWADGRMNGFVKVHSEPANDGPAQGPLVMGYFTRADLPFYYALADAFTICDAYHCSVIGPTMPNRLFALSATIDPDGTHGGPVISTPGPAEAPAAVGSVRWETMFERLSDAGVSWKTYQEPGTSVGSGQPLALALGFNALLYFDQYVNDPSSELYQRAFLPVWPDEFAADVANDTLPSVSWMLPTLVGSEHASATPAVGQRFIGQVLSTLVSNPEVWAKTVVFLVYDENGGFFDHVAPPVAPPGTPGEVLTVDPLPAGVDGISRPIGLGFRVPALVISPFSAGGYVYSETLDHTSLLRFLETRFGVRVPNLTAWRRKTVGDFTATLALARPTRAVPAVLANGASDVEIPTDCASVDSEVALLDPAPALTPPTRRRIPRQERGRRKHRG